MAGCNCTECKVHYENRDKLDLVVIQAQSGPDLFIEVCPECGTVQTSLTRCCDVPGCGSEVAGGELLADGTYMFMCSRHITENANGQQ